MLLLIIMLLLVSCSLAANPGYQKWNAANPLKVTQISKLVIHRQKTHTVWAVDLTTTRLVRGTVEIQTPTRPRLAETVRTIV